MSETRCEFVALLGAPNAGKSTLINALVGEKVSIVTRKAQTTRSTVRGVMTTGEAQIVFVDTPGLFAPKRRLDRAMVASAWGAAADADMLALLINSRKERHPPSVSEETLSILRSLGESSGEAEAPGPQQDRPRGAAKAPGARGPAQRRASLRRHIHDQRGDRRRARPLDRVRLVDLIGARALALSGGPDRKGAAIRSLAAEITREKLIERLHDELPYQATVETDEWKDQPNGSARIEQTIFVTRESHRKIVLGEGGRTIKAIGTAARKDISEAHGAPVHLFLHVKVRETLARRPRALPGDGARVPEGVARGSRARANKRK